MKATRKSQRRKARKQKKTQSARRAKRSPRGKLKRAVRRFLPDRIFAGLAAHGNTEWSLAVLPFVTLFFAWSGEATLSERYEVAKDVAAFWFPNDFLATTYRGFMRALVRHHDVLVTIISQQLQKHMLLLAGDKGKIAGLIPFVVDGSKVAAPWTKANETQLGKKGRKPKGEKCKRKETDLRPQLTLTMLWHLPLGLPWTWKHGGLADGERTHFRDMLDTLPSNALIVVDAGFVGYDLWKTILGGGREFLIRVGSNVNLITSLVREGAVRREGNIVWLWPDKQRQKKESPLRLRLITIKKGGQNWFLVTSITDSQRLSDDAAGELYTKRWGVECCFRTLKQTYERSKMKSYTPECAAAELGWSLLSLWLVSLLAKQELAEGRIDAEQYSPAGARKLIRKELRRQSNGIERLDVSEFQTATKDQWSRRSDKKARHDQRKKHDPAPKPPNINDATKEQRKAAMALSQCSPDAA